MRIVDPIKVLLTLEKQYSPNECWPWPRQGSKGYGEYGCSGKEGTKWGRAHRLSYEYFIGSAQDLFVCHHCDNPPCVNPKHLYVGTNYDNMQDKKKRGRQNLTGLRGARKHWPYLTQEAKSKLIAAAESLPKRRFGRTEYAAKIAKELNINLMYTMRILHKLNLKQQVWLDV